jgi:hypothetical protein
MTHGSLPTLALLPLVLLVEVANQLLSSILALQLQFDSPVTTEQEALDDFIKLYCSLREHLRIQFLCVELVLALVGLPVVMHQVARDGMDQFFIDLAKGEAPVDGALEQVLLVAHKSIKEAHLKVFLEVLV